MSCMTTLPLSLGEDNRWLRRHRLTIIALVAFAFMSILVFEQGKIIERQRDLIRLLFGDSVTLNNVRSQAIIARQQKEREERAAPRKEPAPELHAR